MSKHGPETWEWYGTPGHLIVAKWCRFHLLTKVGNYMVSTVGEYVRPRHTGGGEQGEAEWLADNPLGEDIGLGRKFETMVFPCSNGGVCSCGCGAPTPDEWAELDMAGSNSHANARANHYAMCHKWSAGAEGRSHD